MATIVERPGVVRQKRFGETYIGQWIMTTDHKKIGVMYIVTAFFSFLVGGLEALLIRTQLAAPNGHVLSPEVYNEVFTMHGTTMIFLFVMPMLTGLGNYIVPLMIGARDMAFPRLNADFWALGILLLGVSSIAGALNFVVTILRLRAPGMTMNRVPLFTWMTLVTSFLLLFALPSVTAAAGLLLLDRHLGTHFYQASFHGDPLLWQHLFWSFGHPEVYILILPAFGIISEVLPVFSRKPIFGYTFVAWSGVAIGFLSFTVWAHHMFAVGLPLVAQAFFATSTTLIAIPTAVKIFNWIATVFRGKVSLKVPMLFALGFIAMFLIGGLNGIALAVVPVDYQVTDSYFVVSHLHYVLFGGTVFGVFAGIYYWFPKVTGKLLGEGLGQIQFWLMLIGVNLTFFPMHILGLLGMARRIYTYPGNLGWNEMNLLASIGAFILGIAMVIFLWNVIVSLRSGKQAGTDPWDAFTLEWDTDSPPKVYNFLSIPIVRSRRPFYDKKHPDIADWKTATH